MTAVWWADEVPAATDLLLPAGQNNLFPRFLTIDDRGVAPMKCPWTEKS